MSKKLSNKQKNILIKKIISEEECHHGGAWKIAFADLMTALMAFFLVMWIISVADEDQRKKIADFFKQEAMATENKDSIIGKSDKQGATNSVIDMGGAHDILVEQKKIDDKLIELNQTEMKETKEILDNLIKENNLEEKINMTITKEGLLLEITDDIKQNMFELGSDMPTDYGFNIYNKIAKTIKKINKPISISGYTDAKRFKNEGYDNFRLSSDRANAVKDILINNNISEIKINQVEGFGSKKLLLPDKPYDAKNRRITILIFNEKILNN